MAKLWLKILIVSIIIIGILSITLIQQATLPFEYEQDITWNGIDATVISTRDFGETSFQSGPHACDKEMHYGLIKNEIEGFNIFLEGSLWKSHPGGCGNCGYNWQEADTQILTNNLKLDTSNLEKFTLQIQQSNNFCCCGGNSAASGGNTRITLVGEMNEIEIYRSGTATHINNPSTQDAGSIIITKELDQFLYEFNDEFYFIDIPDDIYELKIYSYITTGNCGDAGEANEKIEIINLIVDYPEEPICIQNQEHCEGTIQSICDNNTWIIQGEI